MEKSTVKDDILDSMVRGAPAEQVTFEGDKKGQATWELRAECPQQRSRMNQVGSAARAMS